MYKLQRFRGFSQRHAHRFVKHILNKSFPTETRLLTYRGRQYTTRIQTSDNSDNKVVPFAALSTTTSTNRPPASCRTT